jgi:IS1 family transposase
VAAAEQACGVQGQWVNWNKELRSVIRGKLNRLVRKTKGYAKSVGVLMLRLRCCASIWAGYDMSARVENNF